jgi:hypothetical protein
MYHSMARLLGMEESGEGARKPSLYVVLLSASPFLTKAQRNITRRRDDTLGLIVKGF